MTLIQWWLIINVVWCAWKKCIKTYIDTYLLQYNIRYGWWTVACDLILIWCVANRRKNVCPVWLGYIPGCFRYLAAVGGFNDAWCCRSSLTRGSVYDIKLFYFIVIFYRNDGFTREWNCARRGPTTINNCPVISKLVFEHYLNVKRIVVFIIYYSVDAADDGSGLERAAQARREQRELATHAGHGSGNGVLIKCLDNGRANDDVCVCTPRAQLRRGFSASARLQPVHAISPASVAH